MYTGSPFITMHFEHTVFTTLCEIILSLVIVDNLGLAEMRCSKKQY